MSRLKESLFAPLLLLACTASRAQPVIEANLALTGGKVWTVDRERSTAEAVAVWNGRILAVGSDREIKRLVGASTQVIELEGKLVLPGFFDSHSHPV